MGQHHSVLSSAVTPLDFSCFTAAAVAVLPAISVPTSTVLRAAYTRQAGDGAKNSLACYPTFRPVGCRTLELQPGYPNTLPPTAANRKQTPTRPMPSTSIGKAAWTASSAAMVLLPATAPTSKRQGSATLQPREEQPSYHPSPARFPHQARPPASCRPQGNRPVGLPLTPIASSLYPRIPYSKVEQCCMLSLFAVLRRRSDRPGRARLLRATIGPRLTQ